MRTRYESMSAIMCAAEEGYTGGAIWGLAKDRCFLYCLCLFFRAGSGFGKLFRSLPKNFDEIE